MIQATEKWKERHPDAKMGFMVMDQLMYGMGTEILDAEKEKVEQLLRNSFADSTSLKGQPAIAAYVKYYKHFKKTYHVLKQQESVAFKGKSIPQSVPIVEAMFMAELKNGLLTAGHDYDALKLPLYLDTAQGTESYTLMSRNIQQPKNEDMILCDQCGVISSIIYGPDQRTRIVPETKTALFVIYAPPGISDSMIRNHLTDMYTYVKMVYPEAVVEQQQIISAR